MVSISKLSRFKMGLANGDPRRQEEGVIGELIPLAPYSMGLGFCQAGISANLHSLDSKPSFAFLGLHAVATPKVLRC